MYVVPLGTGDRLFWGIHESLRCSAAPPKLQLGGRICNRHDRNTKNSISHIDHGEWWTNGHNDDPRGTSSVWN